MSMTCSDIETLVQSYLDGELAEDDASALAEHVSECQACKAHVADEASFHRQLRQSLAPPGAPAGLRDNIALALDREDWAARKRGSSRWGWLLPGSATVVAAAALALFITSTQSTAPVPAATYDDAVLRHVRRAPVEVQGAAVSDWAARHMPRQVQLPRFSTPTTTLRGARLSHLLGRDALQLYYDARIDHRAFEMSALILEASDLDFRKGERHVVGGRELWVGQSKGYNVVAHKDERGIGYVFISEMNGEDLLFTIANSDLLLGVPELPPSR